MGISVKPFENVLTFVDKERSQELVYYNSKYIRGGLIRVVPVITKNNKGVGSSPSPAGFLKYAERE